MAGLIIRLAQLDLPGCFARKTDMKHFKARLTSRGPGGAWTFLEIPFSVEKEFNSKARVAVAGTMNGFAFQNSLMPNGDGTHSMMVSKALQAGAKAAAGDLVSVAMAIDRSERVVNIPNPTSVGPYSIYLTVYDSASNTKVNAPGANNDKLLLIQPINVKSW